MGHLSPEVRRAADRALVKARSKRVARMRRNTGTSTQRVIDKFRTAPLPLGSAEVGRESGLEPMPDDLARLFEGGRSDNELEPMPAHLARLFEGSKPSRRRAGRVLLFKAGRLLSAGGSRA